MQLSFEAIKDLRRAMDSSCGEGFSKQLNDEEINEIGDLLLTVLAEGLKLKANKKVE
jgi:hypothetical protein